VAIAPDLFPRLRLEVSGAVQGVGFRPFVFRLAETWRVAGHVKNTRRGAALEIEGPADVLAAFTQGLRDAPPPIRVQRIRRKALSPLGEKRFYIADSRQKGEAGTLPSVPADTALCGDCRRDLFDPFNRRYRYPFTACAACGPRFSVVEGVPYDRERTTLRFFPLCSVCHTEYENPRDRRFHAQAICCPDCGPQVELWSKEGRTLARKDAAMGLAARAMRDGKILALKGLGGFQLVVDARRADAVDALRQRKCREEKPFAVMVPDSFVRPGGGGGIFEEVSEEEVRLLTSPEGPIVLLRPSTRSSLAPAVAPGNPWVGIFVPTTPLHALLLADLGFPVVATSGNRSDEPICISEKEAVTRLAGIADYFLVHDRPIVRPVEDSVARVINGTPVLLRRGRGYVSLPIRFPGNGPTVLAFGGHMKNTVALVQQEGAVLGPHGGDLDTPTAVDAFQRTVEDIPRLHGARPDVLAADAHPDYASTRYAQSRREAVRYVQHHHAHFAACLAEHELDGPALGIVWDGSGWGLDGTVWGGEFLVGGRKSVRRFAHLRTFPLPGGDAAARDPRRSALGLLYELRGAEAFEVEAVKAWFSDQERSLLARALTKGGAHARTSSAGRLFDGVSALLGVGTRSTYEGQAAMALEFASDKDSGSYPFSLHGESLVVDWGPLLAALVTDQRNGVSVGRIAGRFHNTLADIIAGVAERAGEKRVVLSGGCFQNARLLSGALRRLSSEGFDVLSHRHVPTNDGGLALGQAAVVRAGGGLSGI
jgi:hydrogenase maturation protein HypF